MKAPLAVLAVILSLALVACSEPRVLGIASFIVKDAETGKPVNAVVSSGLTNRDKVIIWVEVSERGLYRVTWSSASVQPVISVSAEGYADAVVPDSATHVTSSSTTSYLIDPEIVHLHRR